jgi:hypothetical protein
MQLFWQNTVKSEIPSLILEYALSALDDVFLISQTCKEWDEIINKNPTTAHPIWQNIAKQYYGGGRHYLHLQQMDSYCKHDDNSQWKRLLFIERIPTLKIFLGEVGPYLKLLVWVFEFDHILPYVNMSWKEGPVDCTLSAEEYWIGLGVSNHPRRDRGIDKFLVDFNDNGIVENFGQMEFLVHYLDHNYTSANFQSECRIIHRWLNVFGFHHYDFSIGPPVPLDDNENGPNMVNEGHIKVTLVDRYVRRGQRVLCLGSMTIRDDISDHYIPGHNEVWIDLSAGGRGVPIHRVRIFYDN